MEFCNSFNSKLVRLKLKSVFVTFTMTFMRFNSKLVRLKRCWRCRRGLTLLLRFNSKLVRLKLIRWYVDQVDQMVFQFQTGSIKTRTMSRLQACMSTFQFQTGSIKTATESKVVVGGVGQFQFQTGSIKTRRGADVQLEFIKVSIPNWFD